MARELTAIIVGAGFSGLAAAIGLKKAGIDDFVILEKDDGVGGTWRANTYPGAACDIPSHLYSYSFAPNAHWSRAYGGQPEILAYLERIADEYELRPHLRINTRVVGARFDDATATWNVTTQREARTSTSAASNRPGSNTDASNSAASASETLTARALILGNGALHLPSIPDVPGLASFKGTTFHSARWNHSHDLAGKRVAVIGTGASAIQFVPQIAPKVDQLDVYQRTPPWILPKADRAMSEREKWALENIPGAHWLRRTGLYWLFESRVLGFAFAPKVNAFAEKLVLKHLAAQVADHELRAKLTPPYRMGCKRVLISNDYYPALQRDNVELVTEGIAAIEPEGVRTVGGQLRPADTLIFGTGFKVVDYVSAMRITGSHGADLNDTWKQSVRNYLGITVSGFPNMFLLMGPNTGLGHNSMVFMIEAQAHYIVDAISRMRRRKLASIEVRPDVEQAFRAEMTHRMKDTVWTSGCNSWYMAPDGDVLLWPGFTFDYWWRTRTAKLSEFRTVAQADLDKVGYSPRAVLTHASAATI